MPSPITVDLTAYGQSSLASWSVTVDSLMGGETAGMLVIGHTYENNGAGPMSGLADVSITYAGVACVLVGIEDAYDKTTGAYIGTVRAFRTVSTPPAGVNSLQITQTKAGYGAVTVVSAKRINQNLPLRTISAAAGTLGPQTIEITADYTAYIENDFGSGLQPKQESTVDLRAYVAANEDFFRSTARFSTSSIPAGSSITSVSFTGYVEQTLSYHGVMEVRAYNSNGQSDPDPDSGSTFYARCSSGTRYLRVTTGLSSVGVKTLSVGPSSASQACVDLTAAKAALTPWTLAFLQETEESADRGQIFSGLADASPPKLTVTYAPTNIAAPTVTAGWTLNDGNDLLICVAGVWHSSLITYVDNAGQQQRGELPTGVGYSKLLISVKEATSPTQSMGWTNSPSRGWAAIMIAVVPLLDETLTGTSGSFAGNMTRKVGKALRGSGLGFVGSVGNRATRYFRTLTGSVGAVSGSLGRVYINMHKLLTGTIGSFGITGILRKNTKKFLTGTAGALSGVPGPRYKKLFADLGGTLGALTGTLSTRHNRWFQALSGTVGVFIGTVNQFWFRGRNLYGFVGGLMTLTGGVIDNIIRVANNEGDGYTPDSAVGVWFASSNYVQNSSFEDGTTGWSPGPGGTIQQSTVQKKFGNYSLLCLPGSNGTGLRPTYAKTSLSLLGRTTYTASAWVYLPFGFVGGQLRMRMLGFGDITGVSEVAMPSAQIQWTFVSMTFTTGDDTTGTLEIESELYNPGQAFYLDAVQVEPLALSTPFIDTSKKTVPAPRPAGRITGRASLIDPGITRTMKQGWVACAFRVNWAGANPPVSNPRVFSWESAADPNNRIIIYFDTAVDNWVLERTTAGVTQRALVTQQAHYGGEVIVLTAGWSATSMEIEEHIDGQANFAWPVAASGYALDPPNEIHIGTAPDGANCINATFYWFAAGTGNINGLEVAIGGYAYSDPPTSLMTSIGVVTNWDASTGSLSGALKKKTSKNLAGTVAAPTGLLGKLYKQLLTAILGNVTFIGILGSKGFSPSDRAREAVATLRNRTVVIARKFRR